MWAYSVKEKCVITGQVSSVVSRYDIDMTLRASSRQQEHKENTRGILQFLEQQKETQQKEAEEQRKWREEQQAWQKQQEQRQDELAQKQKLQVDLLVDEQQQQFKLFMQKQSETEKVVGSLQE